MQYFIIFYNTVSNSNQDIEGDKTLVVYSTAYRFLAVFLLKFNLSFYTLTIEEFNNITKIIYSNI